MTILIALLLGCSLAAVLFLALASIFVRGFAKNLLAKVPTNLGIAVVLGWAIVSIAAVTQLNLATQVQGVLPTANGGTAVNGTAVFPSSGTVMTTSTAVTASQLPNPSASTLGGVESIDCTGSGHILKISTSGVPSCAADAGVNLNQGAPSGSINGSNTTFTLSPTPTQASDVDCFENGLQQQQGAGDDYTISGATITYLTAPATGTKLNCLWF
jgi:hypothetical protein